MLGKFAWMDKYKVEGLCLVDASINWQIIKLGVLLRWYHMHVHKNKLHFMLHPELCVSELVMLNIVKGCEVVILYELILIYYLSCVLLYCLISHPFYLNVTPMLVTCRLSKVKMVYLQ